VTFNFGTPFTKYDDTVIRDDFLTKNDEELSYALGRTPASIKSRIKYLGLSRKLGGSRTMVKPTEDEARMREWRQRGQA
jgi:hypothetical protein